MGEFGLVRDTALDRLVEQVQGAAAAGSALEIRGGASKRFYGEAAQGTPLDTRELSGISSYEPTELVVTVRAGTPLAELEAALAERQQCLPFEPPRLHGITLGTGGTVGGMVAAGLSGPARVAVGCVRDYVLGASLLNGRGELLSFGGQVMKNVAGYDVSRLLAGSLGVLGVICEVSLKVLPVAPATCTLRFDLDEAQMLQRLNAWGGQPLPVNASAWWDGTLALRLRGAQAAVEAAARTLGGEAIAPELADGFWNGMRDQGDDYFVGARRSVDNGASLWRLSVPQTAPPLKLSGAQLVEWGGALRWLCTTLPAEQVRNATASAGGHATLYMTQDKSPGVFAPLAPPLARIHRQLKASFDPQGIFNPGRMYPQW
jgi:glycolate oxidase FAD binding subunit